MKNLEEIRKILVEHKEEIRKKDGVVITGIFGSYSKGRQEESSDIDILSDIDVLVEIEKLIGFKLFGL